MASLFEEIEGFEWDDGNSLKNWHLHRVTDAECEQLFFNRPILIGEDAAHSRGEQRFAGYGVTNSGRRLTVIFTIRERMIRVISARDMTKREENR